MLLAIDTATQVLSLALHDGAALRAEWSLAAGRRQGVRLAPMIEQLLQQTGLQAADLTALAVAVGPGSYTGLRIGVALAKGLAAVDDLPLVPLTTLEIVLEAHAPARHLAAAHRHGAGRAQPRHLGQVRPRGRRLGPAAAGRDHELG